MRPLLIFYVSTFLTLSVFGQYPFEKKPAIKYKKYENWKVNKNSEAGADYSIIIPNFYSNNHVLKFQITSQAGKDTSVFKIYDGSKLIQTFVEPGYIGGTLGPTPQSVFLEDVNGDGLKDFKILIPNSGCCGGYNYYLKVIYLFQKKNGTFTKISFSDLMMFYVNRPERDIDGDRNFEIITQTFQTVGEHHYWLFNLYDFNGNELVNVNQKNNYPIMVQLLYRNNYKITDKISRNEMKRFDRKLPDDYDKK